MARDLRGFSREAVKEFISRTTVWLAAENDFEEGVGSALLFKTNRGIPFLLTARHQLSDRKAWKPLRLVVPGLPSPEILLAPRTGSPREIEDAGVDAVFAPPRSGAEDCSGVLDVAVVTLRKDLHERLRPLALGLESIPEDDTTPDEDVVVLCGFPGYLAFEDRVRRGFYWVTTMTYFTGVKGRDKQGRLEVEWSEAIPDEDAVRFPHLHTRPGVAGPLGDPGGISGGGVWRIKGAPKGARALWSPSSHARLIGVPVAHREDLHTEYAESVTLWGRWLLSFAEELDRAAP